MEKKGATVKCCTDQAGQVDPRLVNGKLTLQGESPWQVREGSSPGALGAQKREVLPGLGERGGEC